MLVISVCLVVYPKVHWFDDTGEGTFQLNGTVDFLGHDLGVYLTAEAPGRWPTIRQRWLLLKLESYDQELWSEIGNVAVENLHAFEDWVGDMTDEYGLPEMSRENINDFFTIDMIWIPKQSDSTDDYVGFCFACEWETEHGMYMLMKNGKIVWHGWSCQQWHSQQWHSQSGWKQMNAAKQYGVKRK